MSTDLSANVPARPTTTGVLNALPPWACIVIAIVSVQLGAAIATQLFDTIGWAAVVFLRTFLGGIILVAIMRPRIRGHKPHVYRMALLYGTMIAVNMLTFYAAIDLIPLGVTVAIAFAGPLSISVAGSRRLSDLIPVTMAVIGILLLSPIADAKLDANGVLLALLCAAAWGAFVLVSKRATKVLPGDDMVALGMCAAGLVSAPFGAVRALPVLNHPDLLIIALVVALLSSVIPFWFEFSAFRRLSARTSSLLLSLEPAVAALMGWLILHEALSAEKVFGIGLIWFAAAITTRSEDTRVKEAHSAEPLSQP